MKNRGKIISWLLFLFWIGLIFYMSSQPGEVSSKQSNLVIKLFEIIGIDLNDKLGELATLIVRKTAHFTEYLILYFITVNFLKYNFQTQYFKVYSLLFVFLYACSDEIHQYFVPGRAMAFRDVLIDTLGGLAGYLIYKFYLKCKVMKRNNILIYKSK